MWLIWMTDEPEPVAVAMTEMNAVLLVRALNQWDVYTGAGFAVWYSPANDPYDHRYDIEVAADEHNADGTMSEVA